MSAAFASVKQAAAGVVSSGYAEDSPASGPAVLLLHGGPYYITARSRSSASVFLARGYQQRW